MRCIPSCYATRNSAHAGCRTPIWQSFCCRALMPTFFIRLRLLCSILFQFWTCSSGHPFCVLTTQKLVELVAVMVVCEVLLCRHASRVRIQITALISFSGKKTWCAKILRVKATSRQAKALAIQKPADLPCRLSLIDLCNLSSTFAGATRVTGPPAAILLSFLPGSLCAQSPCCCRVSDPTPSSQPPHVISVQVPASAL